ncbi:hypothetical protein CMQ_7388 [Grosmannia clavigera kw1407]|uniref:N-acetyltransferase domain-containing protein n=1 Tax=Grosmannia clavigera (strain kw1407 / UAMH 11150) TaxID=655863 RepID=F0XQA4_GROCL|nr:uncharacterized protein CMQ_7388 [Grosmannia clavigera kw1407]EFX00386.1 hypothetical protein CMQ_7388 [Grosmannia clavigera kw1407]
MGPHTGSVAASSHSTDWKPADRHDYLRIRAGNDYHFSYPRNGSRQVSGTHYGGQLCGPVNTQGNGTTQNQEKGHNLSAESLTPYRQAGTTTHIAKKSKESQSLTKASPMAVTQAWNKKGTSPVEAENFRNSDTVLRPEDSVSAVCGNIVVPPEDIDTTAARHEMTETSGADWKRNLSKRFATTTGFSNYVSSWNSRIIENKSVPHFEDNGKWKHWQCAIDAANGKLLDPVTFPQTLRDDSLLEDDKARMRRRTGTAISACKAYIILHGDQIEDDLTYLKRENTDTGPTMEQTVASKTDIISPASPASPQNLAIATLKPASSTCSASCPSGPVCPRAGCYYIRPAKKSDMKGVREIYNLEVLKGTQATDAEPLDLEDISSILTICRKSMLPFIVAIAGQNDTETPEEVMGFGFLSIYQPGLAGGLNGTSRYSVKVNVFVHANHRQKGVGSTILSKLLQLCSLNYSPKKDYGAQYFHSDDTELYRSCHESPRQYHQVFAEVLCGGERGIAEMWYGRVLTSDFGFQPLGKSIMGAHWSNVGQCWLGKLVFQHDCYAENVLGDDDNDDNDAAVSGDTTADHARSHEKGNEEEVDGSPPNRSFDTSEPVSSQVNGGVMLSGNAKDTHTEYW